MNIKPLPTKFKTNGLNYQLIKRQENICLVKVMNNAEVIVGYEIHKIRVCLLPTAWLKNISYANYTHYERYASNEDFGKWAWSYLTLDQVKKDYSIFDEVL